MKTDRYIQVLVKIQSIPYTFDLAHSSGALWENLLYTPMSADRSGTYPDKNWLIDGSYSHHLLAINFPSSRLALQPSVCNEVVDWLIAQSCFGVKYEQ